ncbi:hypothetical protein [Thiosocius teredinicola]|uniref:hypothetical protein n=1 Tax=Thiosocius teredinicola TaxID=1973002 RepID=UPI000F792F7C
MTRNAKRSSGRRFARKGLASVLAILALLGGQLVTAGTYDKARIHDVAINPQPDGSTVITAKPILETLYWCPGAVLQETDTTISVSLVRCWYKSTCDVDIEAVTDPAAPGVVKIVVPPSDKRVEF